MIKRPPPGTKIDRTNPLARDLRYAFPLTNGLGDEIVKGVSHTIIGNPTTSQGVAAFDRVDDAFDYGDFDFTNWPEITVVAWINYNGAATNEHTVVSNWSGSADNAGIWMRVEPADDTLEIFVRTGTGQVATQALGNITPNQWHQVVLVYDADNLYGFQNGIRLGTGTASTGALGSTLNTNNFEIGAAVVSASDDFGGLISDVLIYERALTANEIRALYENRFQIFKPQRILVPMTPAAEDTTPAFDSGSITVFPLTGPLF